MADTPNSSSPSRSSTPNPRFTSQTHTAEDLLKEQTVGLVHLSDFRKRRAEAIEQLSRDGTPMGSGASTPDGREPDAKPAVGVKKRKKVVKKGGLSFGGDNDEEGDEPKPSQRAKANDTTVTPTVENASSDSTPTFVKKRHGLRPNTLLTHPHPKALTKSALLRDAQLKESLPKEFLQIQEAVKATEFILPFVFYDGRNHPGGACRMKKGDFVWLFLERARKVGAGGGGSRKDWARIGVDDLMVVRGEIIVGHHYDFHHFILNRSTGYDNKPIFSYSAEPTSATPKHLLPSSQSPSTNTPPPSAPPVNPDNLSPYLKTAADLRAESLALPAIPDSDLEGFSSDPAATKVVDRRWYERNKHIYPASVWEEFEAGKDYSKGGKRDGVGNAFFFSQR